MKEGKFMKTVKAKIQIAGEEFNIDLKFSINLKVEDVDRFIKIVKLFDIAIKSLKTERITKKDSPRKKYLR